MRSNDRSPSRWRVTAYLCAAATLNFGDRSAFAAVLAPLRSELGLSDATLGILSSLFLWSYALASPLVGYWADRFSRRRIVVASLALWSLFMALTGSARGLIVLVVARIGLGLGESAFHPAGFALLADHHGSATRGRAVGILNASFQIGVVLGGTCAGVLAEHYGWRSGFWVLGSLGVGLALISRQFLADGPIAPGLARQPVSASGAIGFLARSPSCHVMAAKQIFGESMTWIMRGWLPLYLLETFHLKLGAAGFLGTFMLEGATVLGSLAGGVVSDRLVVREPRRLVLAMALFYLAAAPFPLVFVHAAGLWPVALMVSVFSFFRGSATVFERPAICEFVPPHFRGTVFGIMNTFALAAGGAGVATAGLLKHRFGLGAVFASSSALCIVTGVFLLIGYRFFVARDIALAKNRWPLAFGVG